MVVPWASCYGQYSLEPLQMFGRGQGGGDIYLSLFTYRGPRSAPRPRLVCHSPKLNLQQIYRMLKVMRQVRQREAAAANSRKQASVVAAPASPGNRSERRKQASVVAAPASPGNRSERRCVPICFRRRRNASMKRVA